ncbi:Glucarate dehydratase [Podospora aff. communis PSN243]|uniref:Glucarate dehydratase n=1 Tax=Podospora aff. communis PSN243 TaxID=3040156 RepID=A0AAV9G1Q9_9PEZI|nr:Glucarate dehydratase [Podospora aff. communis PSN243]
MRLEAWVSAACLASTVSAIGPASPGSARPKGKPEKLRDFKWTNPFEDKDINHFRPLCGAERTFHVKEYLLDDVSEEAPLGLAAYQTALKAVFNTRQYPGSWDGIDPHGYDRNLLQMEYADVPIKVREWIEQQERSSGDGKGLFAVFKKPPAGARAVKPVQFPEVATPAELRADDKEKTVLFAPGAIYSTLPLWVAEDSECQDTMSDIEKYSPKLVDGGVVGYPIRKTRAKRWVNKRDAEFTIKAEVLKAKPVKAKSIEEPVKPSKAVGESSTSKVAEEPAKTEAVEEKKKDEL